MAQSEGKQTLDFEWWESQSISKQFDLRSLKVVYLFEEEKRENTRDQSFDHSSFSSCYLFIFFCALSRRNNNLSQEVEKNRVKKCQLSFKLFPYLFCLLYLKKRFQAGLILLIWNNKRRFWKHIKKKQKDNYDNFLSRSPMFLRWKITLRVIRQQPAPAFCC